MLLSKESQHAAGESESENATTLPSLVATVELLTYLSLFCRKQSRDALVSTEKGGMANCVLYFVTKLVACRFGFRLFILFSIIPRRDGAC